MAEHVCPWWGGFFIDNSLRRLIHNPTKLLGPYVKPGMTVMLEPDPITADGLLGMFVGRTFVITEDGSYSATKSPVELTVV